MNRLRVAAYRLAAITAFVSFALPLFAASNDVERQRALFKSVYESVERGSFSKVDALPASDRQLLERYILWPDLRATWLRANLRKSSPATVEAFLRQYGTLRPARELRYRYALELARRGDFAAYLKVYEQFYQGQDIAKLDCLALQGEIRAGRYARVNRRALDLWTVGFSQVDECDPVFKYLAEKNLLGVAQYRQRFDLAIAEKNFSLAKWLGKNIDADHIALAARWQQAQANPEDFLRRHRVRTTDSEQLAQLAYAVERLTYRDPIIALELWRKVSKTNAFSEAQKARTSQHIALWTARDNLPGAYGQLRALSPGAQSDEVLRWRARVSLRQNQWQNLISDISLMNAEEQASEEWRYWRAIATRRLGAAADADLALAELSAERSYYGFLAADELGRAYALDDASLIADEVRLTAIAAKPAVVRAKELFLVGQDSRGRSEWDAAIRAMSTSDQSQAAILAHRMGWHSRAIATAARIGEYDDLSIRYPLPYQSTFESFSSQASIAPTWAYGIARSESLFMRDVRSSAGAIGLMQLMPATGRDVAKGIRLPYSGTATLVDPQSNIRLGTTYLGQMAARYSGNPVPATAAYNAGPHRVDRWLPAAGEIDARIWIENIPFNETRKYVKRVMAAEAIFHWRMTGKYRRLSDQLPRVEAATKVAQVAGR